MKPMDPKAAYPFRPAPEDDITGGTLETGLPHKAAAGSAPKIARGEDETVDPEAGPSRKHGKESSAGKPKGIVTPVHDDDVSKYSFCALPRDVKRFLGLRKQKVVVK